MARDRVDLKVSIGVARDELREWNEARWRETLTVALAENGRSRADLEPEPPRAAWKIEIATRLRRESAVPYRWIAQAMNTGDPAILRVYIRRKLLRVSLGSDPVGLSTPWVCPDPVGLSRGSVPVGLF